MEQTIPPVAAQNENESKAPSLSSDPTAVAQAVVSTPAKQTPPPTPPQPRPRSKFKFKKRYILLAVLITFIIIVVTVQELGKKRVEIIDQNPRFNVTQAPTPTPEEEPAKQWKSFTTSQHGITFSYSVEAYLEKSNPFSQDSPVYKAIFRGKRQDEGLITETNLSDGYIFKVTVNTNPENRSLLDLTQNKKSSFAFNCPDLAEISDITATKIDGLAAQTFSVINCNSDFKVTFVVSKNFVYEIDQIFRGDIGFKQKYETDTDEIVLSLKIDRELPPPEDPIVTFASTAHGFSFMHPRFNTECCQVPSPIYGNFLNTGRFHFVDTSLGVPEKNKPFDGFGIFVDINGGETPMPFETYLDNEKKALLEDYRIITGRNPDESEEKIKIGGVEAVLLKGYAWWGDVIMLQIPNTSRVMLISKTEFLPGSFRDVFNDIMNSFTFN